MNDDLSALPIVHERAEIESHVRAFLDVTFPNVEESKKQAWTLDIALLLQQQSPPLPDDVRQRYRKAQEFFDRALAGVPEETKRNVLRVMMNLRVYPDDEMNVLFAVYGYFAAMAESVPKRMRDVLDELEQKQSRFLDDVILMKETGEKILERLSTEIEPKAIDVGKAAVQSAVASEYDAIRYHVTTIIKEIVAAHAEEIKRGRAQPLQVMPRPRQLSALIAVVLVVVLAAGIALGRLSPHDTTLVRAGATYLRMWKDPAMPTDVRAWLRRWAQTH